MTNPLLADWTTPFGLPPFADLTDDDFGPAIEAALTEARTAIAAIADQTDPPSFANTIDALELAGQVHGWTFEGGDGVLDAGTNGDGVNRGVLAGLVLTVDDTDTTSQYVEFLVDDIEFDAPFQDPTYPPTVGAPGISSTCV